MIKQAILSYLKAQKQAVLTPKAVLFDMDGVLYDSMRFHARAWKEVANLYSLPFTDNEFYMFEGRTGASTINVLVKRTLGRDATEAEKKEIYQKKAALFNTYNDGEAMHGAAAVLQNVKVHNLQTLVVTGSGQQSLINKLNHTYPHCFERSRMVTADDVSFGKPHPEPYLMALEKAGVKACEAIVIENAPLGVEAAVAAGIFTIAVNTGPLPNNVLLDAGANLLYPDMESLANDWHNIMEATGQLQS